MVVVMVGTFLGVGTPRDYLSPVGATSACGPAVGGERIVEIREWCRTVNMTC